MRKRLKVVLLSIIALSMLIYPIMLNARAGGGHSFGGGGSPSFSGGFSGGKGISGGGDIIGLVIFLLRYPQIGLPIIIGGVIFFYFMGRGANNYRINSTIRKATYLSAQQESSIKMQNLERLKTRDPQFSEEIFLDRARNAFITIQKAWSDQNLLPIRTFVSNGLYTRFAIQIDIQKAEGYRNKIENINILSASIASITSDNLYDRIDVAFSATMDDSDVELKSGKVLKVNESTFTEYWTFLRRINTKTRQREGLIEGKCPNCGGKLNIVESGRCEYCNAFVFSGEYDWILTEITQEEEYSSPYFQNNVWGLEEMLKKDPTFNLAAIEDKASYFFFKMYKANYFGDTRYLKEVSHPKFYHSLSGAFNPSNDWYQSLKDAAIGAVETKRIQVDCEDGYDKVDVMIRWSAEYCERNRRTKEVRNVTDKSIRTQTYTLVRKSNVTTKVAYNFKILPCPICGAPISSNVEDKCDYCGNIINDGSRDWVLYSVDIYRPYAYNTQFTGITKNIDTNKIIIAAMISAMLSDKMIDEREKEMIYTAAQNRGISKSAVDQMIESAKRGELIAIPTNTEEAREIISSMARISLVDGKLSNNEYKLLLNVGEKYNYKKADINGIINNQRRLLFNEAKEFIKNTKFK
ncbi:MAG: TIM44-like domain-containing protein [Deltaproteobacteria bacterium]|nr:TIM44-like domain-containing protein [Deltaproteobacteria bacterium]